jgi:hypothetical protein
LPREEGEASLTTNKKKKFYKTDTWLRFLFLKDELMLRGSSEKVSAGSWNGTPEKKINNEVPSLARWQHLFRQQA